MGKAEGFNFISKVKTGGVLKFYILFFPPEISSA